MWPFKKKDVVNSEITKLMLLGKTCYNCRHSFIGNELLRCNTSTSNSGYNPCIIGKGQKHNVCEIWCCI